MNTPMIIKGMVLSAISFLFFTCFDTTTKFLSAEYSVFQIMSVEFVTAALLLVAWTVFDKSHDAKTVLRIQNPKLHIARGITQITGQSLVFLALPHVSLAEFYIIIFCMPILVTLISQYFLKEKPANYIWLALAANFIGILIALRPDQGMNVWALVAFAGAFALSCSLVILRKMMATESAQMTAITTSIALAIGAIIPMLFVYKDMQWGGFGLMVLGGVLFACAQLLLTNAYRFAPAALVSPPQFLQLIYGAITGYLVFGDVPNMYIYIGGVVVIAANIWLLVKQHAQAKTGNL